MLLLLLLLLLPVMLLLMLFIEARDAELSALSDLTQQSGLSHHFLLPHSNPPTSTPTVAPPNHPTPLTQPPPQDLVSRLSKPMARLQLLSDVAAKVAAKYAGAPAILSLLHATWEEKQGQAEASKLLLDLLQAAAVPYFVTLATWLT